MDFNGFFGVSVYFTLASFCQIFVLTNKKKKLRSMLHYILREKTPERNFFFYIEVNGWLIQISFYQFLSSVNGSVKMSTYAQTVVLCLFLGHKKNKTHGSKSICFCYFTYSYAGSVKKTKQENPRKWHFCLPSDSSVFSHFLIQYLLQNKGSVINGKHNADVNAPYGYNLCAFS